MHQQMMDERVYSTSLHLLALGKALDIDPKKMAAILTDETEVLKKYGNDINEEIEKIREANKAAEAKTKEEAKAEAPADSAPETK
jgi:gas vesicle protein